jgi:hypothetical protein
MMLAGAGDSAAAVGPLPFAGNLLTTAASFWPKTPPLATVKGELLANLETKAAEGLVEKNLTTFQTELTKLKNKPKEAEVYVKKAAKEYHFKLAGMTEARSAVAMNDALDRKKDFGLKELQDAYFAQFRSDKNAHFLAMLFRGNGNYQVQRPFFEQLPDGNLYLLWRNQDQFARTRTFQEAREEVEAAWREEKARQLARREAERIRDEIANKKIAPGDAEAFLREQDVGEVFQLSDVAELVPRPEVRDLPTEYDLYTVPEDKRELMPYPPEDLVTLLMALKTTGEAIMFADRPARNYYVAVLLNRSEPTIGQFETIYKNSPAKDTLLDNFLAEQSSDFHQKTMEQLRRDAVGKRTELIDKQGRFVLPEEVRRRETGEGSDE